VSILNFMLDEGGYAPEYAHKDDAGMDLRTPESFILYQNERKIIDLKIHFFIEPGFYLAIVPKSGLAAKKGLSIVNTPGTIDAGYTDSVKVILINLGEKTIEFEAGDKVCQAILKKKEDVELIQVFEKPVTERGDNGFGSSGK
jgi:dUTP pyrophosphatase